MKNNCCQCFKAISVKSRFKIFDYLKNLKKKANVTSLVKLVGLRQPTVTFHINQLVKRGFVRKIKVGRNVYCQVHKKCDNCPLFA